MTWGRRDPVAGFAARLGALREEAGEPSLNRLVELTEGMTWPLKRSTIGDKLNGRSVVSWEFVSSFVTACVAHAQSAGRSLRPELAELRAWDQAHAEMLDAVAADRSQALQAKAARSERARRAARSSLPQSPQPASSEGHDQPALGAATGPVRTYYQEQVERIAPPDLIGRERELAELAEFCTTQQPGSPSYMWWRAKAWSGKTALMSWFVLHPPPGIWIVSFFVTARFYSLNDRAAFIDNLMEQLLALLGKPLPLLLGSTTTYSASAWVGLSRSTAWCSCL
jgi:hypothetical protein